MAKFDLYSLLPQERNKLLNELYTLIVSLKTKEQIISFFKDLLTPSEAVMLARRIQIAKMLLNGDNYEEIRRKLKIGIGTITRVQRWLKAGFGGYTKALEKVIKREEAEIRREENIEADKHIDPNSLEGLAHRYPLYWGLTFHLCRTLKGYGEEKRGRKKMEKK